MHVAGYPGCKPQKKHWIFFAQLLILVSPYMFQWLLA